MTPWTTWLVCAALLASCARASSSGQRCGPTIGGCPAGNCCSRFGYCGNSREHCSPAQGCIAQCTPACGDSVCDASAGETCTSCAADCGWCGPTVCGNLKVRVGGGRRARVECLGT